jgi:hypothetical protein
MDTREIERLLGRIAIALESIAFSFKAENEILASLDEYEETLNRAIAAIKAGGHAYFPEDVELAVARLEHKKLGFGTAEALLKARAER